MNSLARYSFLLLTICLFGIRSYAQDAAVTATPDARQIMVGDQVRVFIEAKHNSRQSRLQWATIPDTFNSLEVVEKGKIDTLVNGDMITYKQRLLVTGFDSGMYMMPALVFPVIPNNGSTYTIQTDSFQLLVQTVAVDTAKPFKGIKDIMVVKSTWRDYIWYIVGALIFIIFGAYIAYYFKRNKGVKAPPPPPKAPVETLQQQALRMLADLDKKQLWQSNQVKEYYVGLTDIIRGYIEARFDMPALEQTTDELLELAGRNRELQRHTALLGNVLTTADLAKFAKAQPTPQEHMLVMELAIRFVNETKPVVTETPKQS